MYKKEKVHKCARISFYTKISSQIVFLEYWYSYSILKRLFSTYFNFNYFENTQKQNTICRYVKNEKLLLYVSHWNNGVL